MDTGARERHLAIRRACNLALFLAVLVAALAVDAARAQAIVTGLEGASGSSIGPDGALYVTEGAAGRISRIDLETEEVTTFASGLPAALIGIGGAVDVDFIGGTAYALVTLVGADLGGGSTVGIYRVDGPTDFTVVADIGTFAVDNPPEGEFEFFVPTGVQYALVPWRGGFLVTDGHHNRVLYVTLDGDVSDFMLFDNTVPTGLAVGGNTIYMAEAGPTPHLPEDGRILSFEAGATEATAIAAGGPLLVDVTIGRGPALLGLAQGEWDGVEPGSPAAPDTGSLVAVDEEGGFTVLAQEVDRPTSLEIVGNTAYVVTLDGEVLKFDDLESLFPQPEEPPTGSDQPTVAAGGGGGGGPDPIGLALLLLGVIGLTRCHALPGGGVRITRRG